VILGNWIFGVFGYLGYLILGASYRFSLKYSFSSEAVFLGGERGIGIIHFLTAKDSKVF